MSLFNFRDLMWLSLSLMVMNSEEKEVNCGSHFTSRTGTISSPNYPKQYSSNLFCVWSVSAYGDNPEIKLKFSDFHLPDKINGKCRDYVSIYHGTDAVPSKLVGTYCGSTLESTQLHKVNTIRIHFVSDQDDITDTGFVMSFTVSVESSSITTSQATAGIVAAIFCGIVFIGVATMRCIMMGACQQCRLSQNQQNQTRECVGTNETVSNYVMDCPPSYRTVMEHPESYPTPHITPYPTPSSSARASIVEEGNDVEPPPPYFCFATTATSNTTSTASDVQSLTTNTSTAHQIAENRSQTRGITAHDVAERLLSHRSGTNNAAVVCRHEDDEMNEIGHDYQNEQSTASSVPSEEDGEGRTEGTGSSSNCDYHERDNTQYNSSITDHHRDGNGANSHNDRNGTSDQNDRNETNNQYNRSGTSDQNYNRNGTNDQNGRSETNDQIRIRTVDQSHHNDNSTNGTSHIRDSRTIHQLDDDSGKPERLDSDDRYLEVRL